ncbi:hypothetical protein DFH09DRAFT_1072827 [Mycena vulgaris]|nr:hypothetical protein DFH09DRAFT_1072827 [Mycena vulgaris]
MSHEHIDLCGLCRSAQLSSNKGAALFPGAESVPHSHRAPQPPCGEPLRRSWQSAAQPPPHGTTDPVSRLPLPSNKKVAAACQISPGCGEMAVASRLPGDSPLNDFQGSGPFPRANLHSEIRPRCHYCRIGYPMPMARVCATDQKCYTCPACTNSQWAAKSIIADKTTGRVLVAQNSVEWLGFSNNDVFDGKSAFKLMQAFGGRVFVDVSPVKSPNLVLNGKRVRETGQIIPQIESRPVDAPDVLTCQRRLSVGMVREKQTGKLLNMMQFICPFCRRKPTVKLLAQYNRRAVVLGGLQAALEDRRFFYAWCMDCGFAKRAYKRTTCAEEGIAPISDFRTFESPPSRTSEMETVKIWLEGHLRRTHRTVPECGLQGQDSEGSWWDRTVAATIWCVGCLRLILLGVREECSDDGNRPAHVY